MTAPLRVLIVEDEALILMQLETLVEAAGHAVVGTAIRTDEAIDLAHAARPDLAFIDLRLCDGDSGIPVAQALLEMGNVMVLFITANPLRLGDDLSGADGVIAKPFTRAVILGGIQYLEECIRRPPPTSSMPKGMQMVSNFTIDA